MNKNPLILNDLPVERIVLDDTEREVITFSEDDIINMDDVPTEYIDGSDIEKARYVRRRIGKPKDPKKKSKTKISKNSRKQNRRK